MFKKNLKKMLKNNFVKYKKIIKKIYAILQSNNLQVLFEKKCFKENYVFLLGILGCCGIARVH